MTDQTHELLRQLHTRAPFTTLVSKRAKMPRKGWHLSHATEDFVRDIEPTRPPGLDPLAVEILERLQAYPEANDVVLGGHLALKHYLDYRTTHDIEAWWSKESTNNSQRVALERLRDTVKLVAAEHGFTFSERTTRSISSLEMQSEAKTIFSVQIADRDIELATPLAGPWHPVRIESLRDNIASKLTALVNRGAPRDFTDVHAVVTADIVSVAETWDIWQQRNPALDLDQAKTQVLKHLESIAARRPLTSVAPEQRAAVAETRRWIREVLTQDPARQGYAEIESYIGVRPKNREAIDYSVYLDLDTLPTDFSTLEAKADYIARICGAWDFGIIPTRETFTLLRSWQDAFDAFPVPASPAYAAFRSWFYWPPLPQWPPLQADYEPINERDGRREDPCRDLV